MVHFGKSIDKSRSCEVEIDQRLISYIDLEDIPSASTSLMICCTSESVGLQPRHLISDFNSLVVM